MRRWLCCCLLPLACCLVTSCSGENDLCIFGYTTKSQFAPDIHTVRVPIFKNLTFIRGIEFQLTEAVQKEIEKQTPWKVVGCDAAADTEIKGTVVTLGKQNVLPNQLNEIREGDVTLAVQIQWTDLRTGQVLTRPDIAPPVPGYVPPAPTRQAQNPLLNAVPGEGPGVMVVRSTSYVPELGESTATARQKVVNDMAKQIVHMLEMPW